MVLLVIFERYFSSRSRSTSHGGELRYQVYGYLGDFENGLVDSGMKISEFEDQIYIPAKDESVESMETVDEHVSGSSTKDASDDELF